MSTSAYASFHKRVPYLFVALFHPNPGHMMSCGLQRQPRNADAEGGVVEELGAGGGLWSLLLRSGLCPLAHRECLRSDKSPVCSHCFPPPRRHKAADLAQNHVMKLSYCRLPPGRALATEWGRKSLLAPFQWGLEGEQGALTAAFCWRSLSPEHRTQRIHSSMCYSWRNTSVSLGK